MLEILDAAALRRWCAGGLAALRRHQAEIDELNVYPVPDGDTGTNLVLTMASADQALDDHTYERTRHGEVAHRIARGALLGARGNSGVIVSQILRGFAEAVAKTPEPRGRALADGLRAGATAAYAAVSTPVEGTVLTVAAAAATAAERADSDSLPDVVKVAATAATLALAKTPEQLPALARAGVVDAGGKGLCVLLDALVEVVTGERVEESVAPAPRTARRPLTTARESGSNEFGYEVQFLLDADEHSVDRLKSVLGGLGDSLVVVGSGVGLDTIELPTWNVHVHVNDVGAAIEAGVVAGRPYQISVTRFDDQISADARATPVTHAPPVPSNDLAPDRAAVVVAAGEGLAALFSAEGARVVAANPSTGELLAAIEASRAAHVVVMPNDPNTQNVARAAAGEAAVKGIRVRVVPTRSPVQALAALAVREGARPFEDDVIAMAEAAGACRYAEVCFASRDALTVAGPCRQGDVLALVEGEVHLIGVDLTETCRSLLDRMLGGGGELVTLITGGEAPAGLADTMLAHVTARWPFVEVHAFDGGHPHYPLLVGVE